MKELNLTLPEWSFLDGQSHLGNTLEGRTVLQHIRSYTMIEVFAEDENTPIFKKEVKTKEFDYVNQFGIKERHIIAIHFSLAENDQLDEILDKAIKFYSDYMEWEDKNIVTEHKSKQN